CKQSVATALDDLERLGFVTRIRRIRRIMTPLGFTTRQITNAYRVHEPARGLGLLATLVFATESNSCTASAHIVDSLNGRGTLEPMSPLHRTLERLGTLLESRKRGRVLLAALSLFCTTVAWAVDHSAAPRPLSDVCPRWLVETGLLGWACEIRTQNCRRKLSL